MDFDYSPKVIELQDRLRAFMEAHVYPNEQRFDDEVGQGDRWQPTRLIEELKAKAKAAGLWNLFLPASERGALWTESGGLSQEGARRIQGALLHAAYDDSARTEAFYYFRMAEPDFTLLPVYESMKAYMHQTPVMYPGWFQDPVQAEWRPGAAPGTRRVLDHDAP